MDLIKFSIENPVKVSVGVLLTALFGLLALFGIPIQLTPNVDQPIVTITTEWRGRSPDDVEREIIQKQEEKLKSVSGLKKMSSIAYEGSSAITMEFYVGTDMREASLDVSNKLREVKEKPPEADEPVITVSASSSETPIAWTIITSQDPNFPVEGLYDYVDDDVKPFLERIDGVSEVRIFGGRERQVHIQIDPHRVAQRGITYVQLQDALRRTNINTSAGSMADGRLDVRVRTVGEYDDLKTIRETVITDTDAGPIRVRDVASVTMTLEKERGFVRNKGKPGLALPIYREVGSNVMAIMAEVRKRVVVIRDDILPLISQRIAADLNLPEPPKFNYDQVYDETVYIDDAIAVVKDNLWFAAVLTTVVLLLFLREVRSAWMLGAGLMLMGAAGVIFFNGLTPHPALWAIVVGVAGFLCILATARTTLIIALAIPISVIGTFVAMWAAGRNLNVVSLAGLAFSIGMVVDNAIVVLENIDRHLAMGRDPRAAAYSATKEVAGAILASTLTTVAVFGPVMFIEEEAGQLFRDIALALSAAVTLSMIVSATVVPCAAVFLLRRRNEPRTRFGRNAKGLFGIAGGLDWIISRIADGMLWLMKPGIIRRGVRLAVVVVMTGGAFLLAQQLMPPSTYMPAGNRNLVFGGIQPPPGYTKDHDRTLAQRVENVVRPYWEAGFEPDLAKAYKAVANQPPILNKFTGQPIENIPPVDNFFFVSVFRGMFTGATSHDKVNVKPLGTLLTTAIQQIPGAYGGAQQAPLFGNAIGGNNRVDVEVTGFDLNEIRRSASALFKAMGAQWGMMNLRTTPGNFDLPSPEVRLKIDDIRANDLKIKNIELGAAVQSLVDGAFVGEYRIGGKSIDILLIRDPLVATATQEWLSMVPIAARDRDGNTTMVPLSSVAHFERVDAPQTIQRIEQQRAVTVALSPPAEIPLEEVQHQIDKMVADLRKAGEISPAVTVTQAGTASKLNDVRAAMVGTWKQGEEHLAENLLSIGTSRLMLALLITYLLMAALFESWLYPAVIMFSVPPAAVGGFAALAWVHANDPSQQLDVLTMLGFVILIGTVVNNAILVVHQSLNFMRGVGDGEGDVTGCLPWRQAIRLSVRTRVKPVMMTTVTTLIGGLPLVLNPGAGSELYRGLGAVVVGGLALSTFYSLYIVPLVFSLVIDAKLAFRRLLRLGPDPVLEGDVLAAQAAGAAKNAATMIEPIRTTPVAAPAETGGYLAESVARK